TRHDLVFQMRRAAIERDALDAAMRCLKDRAAWRFVNAARLHADEAVLDEIEPADAVLATKLIELRQQRSRRQLHAIDRNGIAVAEFDLDILRLVRRLLGRDRAAVHIFLGLVPRILEHFASAEIWRR